MKELSKRKTEIDLPELKIDPRIEQAQRGPVSFPADYLEKLGVIENVEGTSIKEELKEKTGGLFKGGFLPPEVQDLKNRSLQHVNLMASIHVKSQEAAAGLRRERDRLVAMLPYAGEREARIRGRIREIDHYISMAESAGRNISGQALQDGLLAFQKEVEYAARENIRNMRVYEEETHIQSVTLQELTRKVKNFQEDGQIE